MTSADPLPRRDSLLLLEAIHRVTTATVSASDVEALYDSALDALMGALGLERAAVLLYDADGVIRFKAARGLSPHYQAAAEGHSPWAADHPSPAPIVIADVSREQGLGPLRDVVLAEGIRALAFVPLLYRHRLLGKFMLYRDQPHAFADHELLLAQTVAGHIAFALEKGRLEEQLRVVADTLAATLDAVGEAITVQAPDGALILANEAAAAMLGYESAEKLLAADVAEVAGRFSVFDEEGRPLALDGLPGRAALAGKAPAEVLVRWQAEEPGAERYSLVRAHPVLDDAGAVRFAVTVFPDITERQKVLAALRTSEARLRFMASAGRRLLDAPLDPRQVLAEVVDLVVPELADWCVVREVGEGGGLERVSVGHRDEAGAELVERLEGYRGLPAQHPALSALRTGRSLLVREVTADVLDSLAVDDEHRRLLTQLELRSAMVVPLRSQGAILGILSLAVGADRPPYGDADLELAEELAARVAATVDNARSFARERATAETLTRALLPGRLPAMAGLEVAARYRAAGDVGGDFYDCFPTDDGAWMLVVGDVCGRGIEAAAITGITRHTIRAAALHSQSPAAVLADVNRILLEAAQAQLPAWWSQERPDPSFCTVCVVTVRTTPDGARGLAASAGHPLPLHLVHNGELAAVGLPGSLLGVVDDFEVAEAAFHLGPGDALILLTDGVTERRDQGRFFEAELPSVLRGCAGAPAASIAMTLEEAAVAFTPTPPMDDMAALVLSVSASPRPT